MISEEMVGSNQADASEDVVGGEGSGGDAIECCFDGLESARPWGLRLRHC
jgi:hypothetical protein